MRSHVKISDTLLGAVALIAMSALGGTSYAVFRFTQKFFNSNEFLTYRFFLGVLVLILLKPQVLPKLSLRKFAAALHTGAFLSTAMLLLWQGVKYSSTGISAFIVNSEFIFIPIIAYVCFGERISRQTGFLVFAGLIGIGLLSFQSSFQVNSGTAYLFGSIISFSFYAIFNTRLARKMDTFELTVINLSLATIICGFFAWVEGFTFGFSREVILPLIYLGPIITGLRFFLITYGQSKVDASHVGLIYLVEPLTASVIGYYALGENFSSIQFCGILILIATVVGSLRVIDQEEGKEAKAIDG